MNPKDPISVLQHYWGYSQFRPAQQEIIQAIIDRKDVMALLPTGGGKSLCFQVPALALEGLCIVITPLVALMQDQVASLRDKGIKAMAIAGGISHRELDQLLDNCIYGNYNFLYLSPERLQQELVQSRIKQMTPVLIAIDEAHCISQWGHDFRPAYTKLDILNQLHPEVPVAAFTATATVEVQKDIVQQLGLKEPQIFKIDSIRKELEYRCDQVSDKRYALLELFGKQEQSAIIYVRNRKLTNTLTAFLNEHQIAAAAYHGGLDNATRKKLLEDWQTGTIPVMVATNAFGMGIDKDNVRNVVHYQLPDSLESYYQEAGRAARDGKPAKAVLVYNQEDFLVAEQQFLGSLPNKAFLIKIYKQLSNYFQISYGDGLFESNYLNFAEFCNQYNLPYQKTYHALNQLDRLGILRFQSLYKQLTKIKFEASSKALMDYFDTHLEASMVGKTLLRLYGGIADQLTPIRLSYVTKVLNRPEAFVMEQLRRMEVDQLIQLEVRDHDTEVVYLIPREDERAIYSYGAVIEQYEQQKKKQLRSLFDYIKEKKICRQQLIAAYFGEEDTVACGNCDNCKAILPQKATGVYSIAEEIKTQLEKGPKTGRELTELLTFEFNQILETLDLMIQAKQIYINTKNQYYI